MAGNFGLCWGTFSFGGIEGDAAVGGAFAGGISESNSSSGSTAGSLVEGWVGGEGGVAGVGKITTPSEPSPLQGWFGFAGGGVSRGPLAGSQVGVAKGDNWVGLYIEGHAGHFALGGGGYISTHCK